MGLGHEVCRLHGGARIVNGDLRKFREQMAALLQCDQSNKNYVLRHGVLGVEIYKHPLPEHIFDACQNHWADELGAPTMMLRAKRKSIDDATCSSILNLLEKNSGNMRSLRARRLRLLAGTDC